MQGRVLVGLMMLAALAVAGCAQPDADVVTAEAPDLSGVSFDVHQEPG